MSKLKPNQFILPCGAVITERPLLFQTDMVQAILEDRKTQTRREIKDIHPESKFYKSNLFPFSWIEPKYFEKSDEDTNVSFYSQSRYGKPGDLLWLRETWHSVHDSETDEFLKYGYKADWSYGITSHPKNKGIWSPSIHMPKAASRIWLMVEDIRVERVKDISEEDAKAEGLKISKSGKAYFNYTPKYHRVTQFVYDCHSSIESFRTLWNSINSNWRDNPWVWVVTFRVLSKTGRPDQKTIERNYLEVTANCSPSTAKLKSHV